MLAGSPEVFQFAAEENHVGQVDVGPAPEIQAEVGR